MTPAKGYTEMKDSGIEWVGMIPAHWGICKIKYTVTQETLRAENNGGYIGLENVESWSGKIIDKHNENVVVEGASLAVCPNDILFGKLRPYLAKCAIAEKSGCCSTELIVMRPHSIEGRFLKYVMLTPQFIDMVNMSTYGAKMPRANWDFIGNALLAMPSRDEQAAIASYLDTQCAIIDEIIAQAKASMEDYKQWKASIIYEAVTKGLNPNVEMKDSGIEWVGNVPAHWRVTKIKNFVSLRSGITLGKQYPPDAQLVSRPYLRVANVKAEHVDLQDVATIMVTIEEAEKYALKPGELLMTEGGDRDKLGRGTIWHGEIPGCLHQNHVFAVQVDEKYMLTKFLDYLTASPVGREYFDLTAKKTTNLASTNATTILQFSVPIPPLTEQEKIITILDRNTATINEVIAEKETLVSDLESYKKSLIYEVVTGKRGVC